MREPTKRSSSVLAQHRFTAPDGLPAGRMRFRTNGLAGRIGSDQLKSVAHEDSVRHDARSWRRPSGSVARASARHVPLSHVLAASLAPTEAVLAYPDRMAVDAPHRRTEAKGQHENWAGRPERNLSLCSVRPEARSGLLMLICRHASCRTSRAIRIANTWGGLSA